MKEIRFKQVILTFYKATATEYYIHGKISRILEKIHGANEFPWFQISIICRSLSRNKTQYCSFCKRGIKNGSSLPLPRSIH